MDRARDQLLRVPDSPVINTVELQLAAVRIDFLRACMTSDWPTSSQEGVIEIPSQKKFEVFYPKKFTSAPHLTFPPEESTEFCRKIFTITEQRADGFKALADGWAGSAPCLVKWVAEGSIKE